MIEGGERQADRTMASRGEQSSGRAVEWDSVSLSLAGDRRVMHGRRPLALCQTALRESAHDVVARPRSSSCLALIRQTAGTAIQLNAIGEHRCGFDGQMSQRYLGDLMECLAE